MCKFKEELQRPFPPEDIEWRVQQSGYDKNGKAWALIMPYVTNRAIQDRLDNVFGVMGWSNELRTVNDSFLCGITVSQEGKTVTKWDGADQTDVESFKGGISNAMKRAGVQFGIGRYLYKLDTCFADLMENKSGTFKVKITSKDKSQSGWFTYNAPVLPDWALPENIEKPFTGNNLTKQSPVVEKDIIEQTIEKELGGRNLTAEADACKTLEELQVWYIGLPSEMKTKGSPAVMVKNNRKEELILASQTVKPEDQKVIDPAIEAVGKPSFEEIKAMSYADLKTFSKGLGITGNAKRADLVDAVLDKLNRNK